MRKAQIEQYMKETNYRLTKLNEKFESLQDQYKCLEKRVSDLSDELYLYIDQQDRKINGYIDATAADLANRIQCLSDGVYAHIGNQLSERNRQREQHHEAARQEAWLMKFYYDSMISDLQLSQIESVMPGNRGRLLALQNTHVGETCFVIGNGPSLQAADLDMLKRNHIFCLASKGIYTIFDQTDWRPDVWGVSDLDYLRVKQDDINRLYGFPKLVCAQAYIKNGILIRDAIYYPFIQAERTPAFFNQDIQKGVHFYGTITGKLINIAVYMGFKEIYLLGCDHTCPIRTDENGRKVLDTSKPLHFSNDYYENEEQQQKVYQNITDLESSMKYVTDSFRGIKYACDLLGVKIFNATRGGELEVFPRVDMDAYLADYK